MTSVALSSRWTRSGGSTSGELDEGYCGLCDESCAYTRPFFLSKSVRQKMPEKVFYSLKENLSSERIESDFSYIISSEKL